MKQLHDKLLAWYDANKRELPWRKSRDPYRIWISEIMLQQTRVEAVIPYYERFLASFPNVQALAASDPDRLTSLWAGLGYYSRARNLRAAAIDIMARFAGKLPDNAQDLRSLKGIGEYTAAAIASIAYDKPELALDGNLERVLSRLLAEKSDPKKEARPAIRAYGQKLVELGRPSEVNQALMDLSSGICLPKNPRCLVCPIEKFCAAKKLGLTAEIPKKKKKIEFVELKSHGVIFLHEEENGNAALLLARRKPGEWLQGLWDLPWWLEEVAGAPEAAAAMKFGEYQATRGITKYDIHFHVHFLRAKKKLSAKELQKLLPDCAAEYRWYGLEELEKVHLPKPSEKALANGLKKAQLRKSAH